MSSSTSSSSSSSDVPSSTSSLGPIVTTFTLQSANSASPNANGQTWSTGTFYLESGTNRLMVDGLYAVTQSNNAIYTVNTPNSSQYYIICTSPVRSGSALSCQASDGVRTQLAVPVISSANINLSILAPSALTSSYSAVDLIAS
ncbi:hypothetical protein E8E14_009063 [Neopestalotiopsis sp. 37M]|nr:hypothetical protein E8E14_009063 [Neopestalotiopsis sp. 37M]